MVTKKGSVKSKIHLFWVSVCITMSLSVSCEKKNTDSQNKDSISGKLVIYHAGSLSVPFQELSNAFMAQHSNVKIYCEAAGSRACARRITDLGKRCDVLATADSKVIKNLTFPEYADWYIEFAGNEMVLVYHPERMGKIPLDQLPQRLLQAQALYRADPDLDPCGYRTLLVWQLLQRHYNHPGLYEKLLELSPAKRIRPKETDILALFESGQVDCFFIYRSVAQQHNLPYLALPAEVNLSQPDLAKIYAQAQVEVTGKEPGTVITHKGAPIVYGLTIPTNAEHPELAGSFIRFVLSDQGKKIIRDNGQNLLQRIYPPDAAPALDLIQHKI